MFISLIIELFEIELLDHLTVLLGTIVIAGGRQPLYSNDINSLNRIWLLVVWISEMKLDDFYL